MLTILGIDPGKTGCALLVRFTQPLKGEALAVFTIADASKEIFWGYAPQAIHNLVMQTLALDVPVAGVVEIPQSRPGHAINSVLKTGYGYGLYIGALSASGIPFLVCTPQAWTKALGVAGQGGRKATKGRSLDRFKQNCINADEYLERAKSIGVSADGLADAFNIASYASLSLDLQTAPRVDVDKSGEITLVDEVIANDNAEPQAQGESK